MESSNIPSLTRLDPTNAPKLIGVMNLFQIACIFKIPYEDLCRQRDALGAPFTPGKIYNVGREAFESLGVYADKVVAALYGISRADVTRLREHLELPEVVLPHCELNRAIMEARSRQFWLKKDPLLGTDTDRHLASQLNLPVNVIRARRNTLGIPEFVQPILPPAPIHHWLAEEERLLGTMPDQELASILGIPQSVVLRRRHCLRIPNYNPPLVVKAFVGYPQWHYQIGSMPDCQLAKIALVSSTRVRAVRCRYKIPVFKHLSKFRTTETEVLTLIWGNRNSRLAIKLLNSCNAILELLDKPRDAVD